MNAFQKRLNIIEFMAFNNRPVYRDEIMELICLGQTATIAILKELRETGFIQYSGRSGYASYVLTEKSKSIFKF